MSMVHPKTTELSPKCYSLGCSQCSPCFSLPLLGLKSPRSSARRVPPSDQSNAPAWSWPRDQPFSGFDVSQGTTYSKGTAPAKQQGTIHDQQMVLSAAFTIPAGYAKNPAAGWCLISVDDPCPPIILEDQKWSKMTWDGNVSYPVVY